MTDETTTLEPLEAAFERICKARKLLEMFKIRQTVHGMPDYPAGVRDDADELVHHFISAGFLREIPVTEGGLRFRITWKGLCFLDTAYLLDHVMKDTENPDYCTHRLHAMLTALSFY
jgi:hypothetical protein